MSSISRGIAKSLEKSYPVLSRKIHSLYFSNLTPKQRSSDSSASAARFASYLDDCLDLSSLEKLHACMIVRGLEQNSVLGFGALCTFENFNIYTESRSGFNKFINGDVPLWSSIIVAYFRASEYGIVLRFYVALRQKYIGIHNAAITFGLKSCVELRSSDFGRNVHADAFKFGLSNDRYVGSSLIGFYSKCDLIREAARVFDEITDRDVVAYTSMIAGYAQLGGHCVFKAFAVARDMQRSGFEPNRVTLVSLLQCASRVVSVKKGKMIHGYAIRRGIGGLDEVFETSLIDMYVKCSHPHWATVVFDTMDKQSVGSWNALITGHLRVGRQLDALNLFQQMVRENCGLDSIALVNGLSSCAGLGYLLLGKSIHCFIVRKGVHFDLVGVTALVDMYSKCKHIRGAMDIFYKTKVKDHILFNVMIAGYLDSGFVLRALETFQEMFTEFVRPNASTIIIVLSAVSNTDGDKRKGQSIHGYIFRHGFEGDTEVANQLINMYAKWGVIEIARNVFERINNKDSVSFTSIITGYVNLGLSNAAVALFRLMLRENLSPDCVTFTGLLQALNQLGSVVFIREVHGHLYRVFLENDVVLKNSLITAYSKWGKLEMACNLFENMARHDLSSWNTIIAAYGMNGNGIKALELFSRMKEEKVYPDETTIKSVLSACSHSGLVTEGLHIFNTMIEEYGIMPSKEHYGCVVDLLGRIGELEEAYNLLKCVPLSQKKTSILGALLGACRVHGNLEIGEKVGKWILDEDSCDASAYCSVSNLYAGGWKWDKVADLGAVAKSKGLKRTPGYSLVSLS
ncbi:pentatricopeptide repeat-containing protein [Dorcoceras hygrometricum]|uniref:Pentatricopeptide repeat-containing protein n=1 Tax=Dorcoceras hygrometricum TaxID=472368 RepID=A0A2Z7CM08_9LAMI|nr:pentatricopeptide repeat-containing protein [Dorcoceras hygrometricum]